jgi:hypothetical protein
MACLFMWFISHSRDIISPDWLFPLSSLFFFRYRMIWTLHSHAPIQNDKGLSHEHPHCIMLQPLSFHQALKKKKEEAFRIP